MHTTKISRRFRVLNKVFVKVAPLIKYPEVAVTWYEITWPSNLATKDVNSLLHALNANRSSYGLRLLIYSKKSSLRYLLGLPTDKEKILLQLIESFLSAAEISLAEEPNLNVDQAVCLALSTKQRALRSKDFEDISNGIISSILDVGHKERILIQYVFGPRHAAQTISKNVASFHEESVPKMVIEAFIHGAKELDSKALSSLREKHSVAGWRMGVYVGVKAANMNRRTQLILQIVDAFRLVEAPGVLVYSKKFNPQKFNAIYAPFFWPLIISINELTGLLAWPLGDYELPKLHRNSSRQLRIPSNISAKGRVIGVGVMKDSLRKLTISAKDGLMHMHVMGPTGVGKSTLLLNMVSQDIKDGRSVILVDPKGDLVNDVLARIPKNRADDVIVLDPSDMDRPVGLNPLSRDNQIPSLTADDILSIFRNLYGSYFGPRSEDILHAGLLTLASNRGMSLCMLPNLYTNPAFRMRLVDQLNDPFGLNSFWDWFETISDNQRNLALAPVMNKLRAFLMRPAIRRVMGQSTPKLNIDYVINNNKILLINLAKGQLGRETSQLFGSLAVSQIWQAIQHRADLSTNDRHDAFVYVDEVQDYLHLPIDISEVLTQSRSYGVGLILAHQHLGQLPRDLKSALISNARSRICFQLGHDDAVVMSRNSRLLIPEDFENLNRFHIYAKLVKDGKVSPWMSGKTLPPTRRLSDPDVLKAMSRQQFGIDAVDVDEELASSLLGNLNRYSNLTGSGNAS